MKNNGFIIVLFFAVIFTLFSCEFVDKDSDGNGDNPVTPTVDSGVVIVNGKVTDTLGGGLYNVVVTLKNDSSSLSTTTDTDGKYDFNFKIVESSNYYLISALEGFYSDTTMVYAIKDRTIDVPNIVLKSTSKPVVSSSGYAASIFLFSQSKESIGIKESGAEEDAQIVFSVQDSLGRPIDINHKETVHFLFGSHPTGGEYLYPASVETDESGNASVTLNSGFKAGVTQVVAEIYRGSQIIRSKPVLIAIHGGFPSDQHFQVVVEKHNFPYWGEVGKVITVSAYVGDKYTNPVRPGTAVYFETIDSDHGGIIGGSALTNADGVASVNLLTEGSPYLSEATYGYGFFKIRAHTIDENNNEISDETIRLLSGLPIISSISPSTFTIEAGGSQNFEFDLHDVNFNPMSKGQTFTISAKTEAEVEITPDNFEFPDVMKDYTKFYFTVNNPKPDTSYTQVPITIEINTTGPNGKTSRSVSGKVKGLKN